MIGHGKALSQKSIRGKGGPFIQVSVVALVFAIISSLFFFMGMMDLKRLEDIVLNSRMKKAQYIVKGVEKASEEELRNLMHVDADGGRLSVTADREAPSSSVQDAFARALIGMAQEVDRQAQTDGFNRELLVGFAESNGFSSIAVLDEKAEPLIQTGPLPQDLKSNIYPLLDGREEAAIHLFRDVGSLGPLGFAGIHRHTGKGAVVLLLDSRGLQHWRFNVAVKKAAETVPEMDAYLTVGDTSGHTIADAGAIPEDIPHNRLSIERASKGAGDDSGPRVSAINAKFIEFSMPFKIDGQIAGVARVGIVRPADQLVIQERQHIFIWTGVMIFIGLLAMGILYQTQNRHISKLQAIRKSLDQAERLSALGGLAAGVAHEIRNPLNAISMATQRIQKEFSPSESDPREEFERIIFIVRDEIRRLDSIVEDFLCLSRAGLLDLRPHPIADVLGRIVFLIQNAARERGVRIETNWPDHMPSIFMDERKMQQALLNIVRNAMESISGEGTVSIRSGSPEKNLVSIIVQDSGIGMAHEELDRIFDPFYTTKADGTGIGLCIANEIVVAHGGEILVRSEPGKGTTFEILLSCEMG